ncbi:MAG: hemerythrin family protein [Oscillospiraceae bacterium]|jgi:hemerythrin|nr:hemerythrin family protein [Oscillospiraceae bacterium]
MATAYVFDKSLETGNQLIDTQHRELIKRLNALLDACSTGKGRAAIEGFVKSVSEYTAKHFADEEKLQQQSKYPDYINHKRYHDTFKKTVASIGKEIAEQGPTISLTGKVNHDIAGWLITHIKTEDVKVAAHIRENN